MTKYITFKELQKETKIWKQVLKTTESLYRLMERFEKLETKRDFRVRILEKRVERLEK